MKKMFLVTGFLLAILLGVGAQFGSSKGANSTGKNSTINHAPPLSSHGSLAIDSNQGSAYGFSYNYSTSEDADEKAISECGINCEVVERFTEGCAAYAADQSAGSTVYGWGEDSNGASARNRAMNECQGRGGRRCVVRSWGCNGE